jgi:ADP-ribose pyrophosphatase YjhB (NUDIX family)
MTYTRIELDHIKEALDFLSSAIREPSKGLPEEVFRFTSSIVPMINVDLLIKDNDGRTLFTWRVDEFYPPGWHIPGGIIRYKETCHDRILTVAVNELGATVSHAEKPIAINEIIMEPSWRIRGHFISLLYECVLLETPKAPRVRNYVVPQAGEWDWHYGCPDHLYASQEIYRQHITSLCDSIRE